MKYKNSWQSLTPFLFAFVKRPVLGIRHAPTWDWPIIVALSVVPASVSGCIAGLISGRTADIWSGLLLFPWFHTLTMILLSAFLHQTVSYFSKTVLDTKRLAALIVLSFLPYLLLHILSGVVPAIDLVGFGLTCLLLIVGLLEHFHLRKRFIYRLIAIVYGVYFLVWISVQIRISQAFDGF